MNTSNITTILTPSQKQLAALIANIALKHANKK